MTHSPTSCSAEREQPSRRWSVATNHPWLQLEMALWDIQESGQGSAMTILRGREKKGKIVHLQLANRGHECLGKHLFWLPPIGFRNHLPRALFSVNLHLHNQELLLPHSEPQSSFIPGSLPFLNNLGPSMYAFIWNCLQRLWYAGVSEVPKQNGQKKLK